MANIHVLDSDTINQIAAGEVVERPASVVKELVENAIDAGAGAVTVEIKEGGISLIRVTDNGSGIPKEEIPLAFCRHATSKIRNATDLLKVKSMGFRGEALSSIASVAMVELVTKTREEFTGSRFLVEGGEDKGLTEIGAPEGTTFLVRNLFFNTPARRKFLKTPMTEAGYISDLMERFAISHPEVAFKFINNGKTAMQTSGSGNMRDCIYHIYGRDVTAALLEIDCEDHALRMEGFVGKPVISRGNRNYENYFINGRYIKSNLISKAIEEAYKPYTMQHKFPFTVLCITIPPELIDVNVHPTKLEVRFSNGEELYRLLYHAVSDALSGKNMIPDAVLEETKKESRVLAPTPELFERNRITYSKEILRNRADRVREKAIEDTLHTRLFDTPPAETERVSVGAAPKVMEPVRVSEAAETSELPQIPQAQDKPEVFLSAKEKPEQLSLFEKSEQGKEEFLTKKAADHHRIIGQLFATYWLIEYEEQLFIIDQHAAHEKILYEHTVQRMKEKQPMSQMVSPPIILPLSIREAEVMQRYMEHFTRLGFEIEEFGGREYSVRAVPAELYGVDGGVLLTEMIDSLLEEPVTGTSELILDRIATMSCKAAVKGKMRLSEAEARALIDELMTLENPYHCPHGRPVIISMTKQEIEKKFKRIVT